MLLRLIGGLLEKRQRKNDFNFKMVASSISVKLIILPIRLPLKGFFKPSKTLSSFTKMSSWSCAKCTYVNPPSQKIDCEICFSARPQSLQSSSSSAAALSPTQTKWACPKCTFLNPYNGTICEMCGSRASAASVSHLEVDFDDPDEARLSSSVGSVFLPLQSCKNNRKIDSEKSDVSGSGAGCSGKLKGVVKPSMSGDYRNFGNSENQFVGNDDAGGKKGFSAVLRTCSNKRKDRNDGRDSGVSSGLGAARTANTPVEVKSLVDETGKGLESKTWKFMSYNIWFREDLEMHNRMKALGNLIRLHSPDVICLQEVTPSFYNIFLHTNWWKDYKCSVSDKTEVPGGYFCMQLSKLPVESFVSQPFYNSIMGRELCIGEVDVKPDISIIVATSHLESPCPSPPTWNQMFSKERVEQANEAVRFLDKNPNVIFCGDMNWDDKLDGPFPLPNGWVDAWTELRPGEVGWTYDTKSNKMLTGNRTLQKRLDRFACKLKDFKLDKIEMIGTEEIPGLTYVKEKKVKGQVKELELPVLPSDHYGLLLTISLDG